MLEILYRIYKVDEPKQEVDDDYEYAPFESISSRRNIELKMECLICESRDHFKEIIRSLYGENIRFAYSKKLEVGDIYCIIIGEHCWNTEKYFNRIEFDCDYCKSKTTGFVNSQITISHWDMERLLNQYDKYGNKKFCCMRCKERFVEQEAGKISEQTDASNLFVTKDMFTNYNIAGYIYKITKKSTGEFYVGQTIYVPIFRWGQHLTTERFNIRDILDYKFEVIEKVTKDDNILEREKYWIQKCFEENPKLSLNIMQTQLLRKEVTWQEGDQK